MVTTAFLSNLRHFNTQLPNHLFLAYAGTEIIEIATLFEQQIELTSGRFIKARDIDANKSALSSDQTVS